MFLLVVSKVKEEKKMKNRFISMFLVCVIVVGCLTGCGVGKKKKGTSSSDIEISYQHVGLGKEWLDALIEAFNKKYPEYNAYYNATASSAAATAAYGMEDVDTVDLYMVPKQYDVKYLEPLNDVLETTIDGETKSLKEKFNPSYLALEELDGNYYNLTQGGGIVGFVYNKKIFKDNNIKQLPRTTSEFALVCTTLLDADVIPMCHFFKGGYGYYSWLSDVWFAQYEGTDYFYDIYQNPSLDKMLRKDGRYEVLKVYEKIITPANTLKGSNSTEHVSMQTKFLEGQCAMMLTGSWLSSEMEYSAKLKDFEMMKTPVISSIIDKLSTVSSEAELRRLITAIDNVTDGVEKEDAYKNGDDYLVNGKTVSAEDWTYVRMARNTMAATYSGSSCFIPKYSNAKKGAKEFLKFMYSDEGYKIYAESAHLSLPLQLSEGKIDTSKWNAFEQNQAQLFSTTENIVTDYMMGKHRLYIDGGAHPFASYSFVNRMSSQNEAERVTAKQAWDSIMSIIKDRYDNEWMMNIK